VFDIALEIFEQLHQRDQAIGLLDPVHVPVVAFSAFVS
jgi:hypothetical protein